MDESFFRERYDADAANRSRQSWDHYRDWVRVFYEGKRFPPVSGWNDRERDILAGLPAASRDAMRPRLQETAKRLAAEWAKDNAVRKVSTSDLQAWGNRFKDASRDAEKLRQALEEVDAEVARRTASA